MALPNQESRPLVFILFTVSSLASLITDPPLVALLGNPGMVHPETYNYRRPSRGAVLNTAAAAFLDDFGEGVGLINIDGVTGFQGGDTGLAYFKNLELMFIEYHRRRDSMRDVQGGNPDAVKLWLIDTLNLEASEIYPMSFDLVRTRNRPLLFQYRIQLVVLTDLLQALPSFIGGLVKQVAPSLTQATQVISDLAGIGASFESLLTNLIL